MATSSTRAPNRARTKRTSTEIQIPFDEIAKRAYEKFVLRGSVHGFDVQDWFDAEDELRAEYRDRL
jgi:hypothetical protein